MVCKEYELVCVASVTVGTASNLFRGPFSNLSRGYGVWIVCVKMTGCSVPNCKNRSENGKSFFSIPFGRSVIRRRLQWLLRMGYEKPPSRYGRICEDHFTPDQFESYSNDGRKKLRRNAVPSILPATLGATNDSAPEGGNGSSGAVQVEGVSPSDSAVATDSVKPTDSADLSSCAEAENDAASATTYREASAASSVPRAAQLDSTNDDAPAHRATVEPLQNVTLAVPQQAAVILQDTGAPTPTYAVTYVIPNHGAFAVTSHVAVPASSFLPLEVLPQNQPLPEPSQATSSSTTSPVPKRQEKTPRERALERRLDVERKRRRKAEMERDELRRSLKRLLADDQVRALEKGTMRGSSWSMATVQKALQLKVMCGSRVYDYVKKYVVPLPAQRTLYQLVEQMKAADGDQCEVELSPFEDDDECDDVA